ncbi:hypothetical protein N7508_006764 [Penicillium antarcticum]|uniref:uncharacterized protein n=1 Tax=Penicillium antarcticum TaxID=416450 RepID=UPI0023A4A6C6|nr:uncharacterized protein N7508_006764 [Penicillium antarcticum]KAJ5301901.1 hypothetical protein N7508_006764 [Penicillium antarcticum]
MGIGFLLFFADGFRGTVQTKRANTMLVDSLPDSLEYLCIRGYQKWVYKFRDEQEIEGVDEMIPNAEILENPDKDEHLLWSLEDIGYEED